MPYILGLKVGAALVRLAQATLLERTLVRRRKRWLYLKCGI
jgi:hypothetical protein